jgi:PIN domain nuclease of toxin-antitoxin system
MLTVFERFSPSCLAVVRSRENVLFLSAALPSHHRDPFDRILVAQAQPEDLPILFSDAQIGEFDVAVTEAA